MDPATSARLPTRAAADQQIRRAGINLNRWYMIAKSSEVGATPLGRELWRRPIVLFRNASGELHALEDRCAHRLVRLSHGRISGDRLECAYHGWQFDPSGRCVHVPQLTSRSALPRCRVPTFPVMERHGFVWIFPGDPELSAEIAPLAMSEWEDLEEIPSWVKLGCDAHFSYLIENLMDMYHGALHARYQVWTAEGLREVIEGDNQVTALYDATTYYSVTNFTSMLEPFVSALRKLRPARLSVTYDYPNWRSSLGEDFKIFCLICPVHERRTEAYLIHYASLAKFAGLRKAPPSVRRLVKRLLSNVARRLLANLARQDVVMIEQEQQAFDADPLKTPVEINRTVRRVQNLIRRQAAGTAA